VHVEVIMKYFRIPPAAACIIALTSATCFVQDQRDFDEMDTSGRREAVHSMSEFDAENPAKVKLESKIGGIYFVEVELGSKTRQVLIDAHSGEVLRQRDIPSADV
jgi:hypothetical protein